MACQPVWPQAPLDVASSTPCWPNWPMPELARQAHVALASAGAAVTLREIADLSHAYPRELNGEILHWLAATARGPAASP
jgi:hypothetical protein